MNKDIPKENNFIREPVDKITSEILESNCQKFILTGKRGTGRSTILCNLENRGLGTKEQTINMNFDLSISFGQNPNEYYSEELFRHYYELMFCLQILSFLKRHYFLTYEKYFLDIYNKLDSISDIFYHQINEGVYVKDSNVSYLKTLKLSKQILNNIQDVLKIEKLNMTIDRFDWINGSSKTAQLILKEYFNLFNKVIITSDDSWLNSSSKLQDLDRHGYDIKRVEYSDDLEVVKMILKVNGFNLDGLSDSFYKQLIKITNSNLKNIIGSFKLFDRENLSMESLKEMVLQNALEKRKWEKILENQSQQKRLYL